MPAVNMFQTNKKDYLTYSEQTFGDPNYFPSVLNT